MSLVSSIYKFFNSIGLISIRHVPTKKKVVVITGCDSGLGYSLSRKCNEIGLTVVSGCLDLESEGAKNLASLNRVIKLDVRKPETVQDLFRHVGDILEKEDCELHAVVNNAAVMVFGEFEWLTENQIHQQIDVNVLGTFKVAKTFLPLLRKHKGRLINITSHCALSGLPGISIYGASKAAIQNWSECLRVEQGKYGVKVITFIPGSFATQSNIMSRQSSHASEMESALSEEQKKFYNPYFRDFHSYLTAIPKNEKLTPLNDEGLYEKFTEALLNKNPKSNYLHEPWRYKIYYNLFKITPTWLRDILVEKFVNFPKYKIKE